MIAYDLARRGLDESLEAYAARIKRTPDEARPLWRLGGLEALHVPPVYTAPNMPPQKAVDVFRLVMSGLCRIAPGVSVPTRAVEWSDP